jgi:hypothetical protein
MTTIILGNRDNLSVSDDNSIGDTIILGNRDNLSVSDDNSHRGHDHPWQWQAIIDIHGVAGAIVDPAALPTPPSTAQMVADLHAHGVLV